MLVVLMWTLFSSVQYIFPNKIRISSEKSKENQVNSETFDRLILMSQFLLSRLHCN